MGLRENGSWLNECLGQWVSDNLHKWEKLQIQVLLGAPFWRYYQDFNGACFHSSISTLPTCTCLSPLLNFKPTLLIYKICYIT